jgi:hypothetical protein
VEWNQVCHISQPIVIGSLAEVAVSLNALLARWAAYQVATEVLTHEVDPRVSAERSRSLERAAASALLLPDEAGVPE